MSEYNILNNLQQMTMAANAYKTQTSTSDKAIAELFIQASLASLKDGGITISPKRITYIFSTLYKPMKTKHLSLTLQETPSKMLCPPLFLPSLCILLEILSI
jgi:hypothetical protein